MIGDFDLLIVTTCLHHHLTLLTNNRKHYKMVKRTQDSFTFIDDYKLGKDPLAGGTPCQIS